MTMDDDVCVLRLRLGDDGFPTPQYFFEAVVITILERIVKQIKAPQHIVSPSPLRGMHILNHQLLASGCSSVSPSEALFILLYPIIHDTMAQIRAVYYCISTSMGLAEQKMETAKSSPICVALYLRRIAFSRFQCGSYNGNNHFPCTFCHQPAAAN